MQDQSNEPGASWWAELHDLKTEVRAQSERLAAGDLRMTEMQRGINENTRLTAETNARTNEIYEFLTTMKSLLKLGDMLSTVTIKIWKPISYVAGAIAAFATAWTIFRSGK